MGFDNNILEKLNMIFKNQEVSLEEKEYLLKLKKIYLEISKLSNIEKLENDLYKGKTNYEKCLFELNRIEKMIEVDSIEDLEINNEVFFISKDLLNSKNLGIKSIDEYESFLRGIIKIEIKLGIPIALFVEFKSFFEELVNDYGYLFYHDVDDLNKRKRNR